MVCGLRDALMTPGAVPWSRAAHQPPTPLTPHRHAGFIACAQHAATRHRCRVAAQAARVPLARRGQP